MNRLLFLLFAACGPTPTHATVTDGTACVDAGIQTITFSFDTCLSSSCDTVTSSSCTATLAGETVTVTGVAEIESVGDECTADCGLHTVTCPMPELPGTGEITVVVGETSMTLAEFACDAGS